jgi:hypothetical protein
MSCEPKPDGCGEGPFRATTLAGLFREFIRNRQSFPRDDVDSYPLKGALRKAISRAAWAKRDDNKRHSHQRRLQKKALTIAEVKLLNAIAKIRGATDFQAILDIVQKVAGNISGLGELYVYDTALRIGRALGHSPKFVYLHAGTKQGAKALGLEHKRAFIPMSAFPDPIAKAAPEIVEDFLCVCKDKLARFR